jgi:nitrate/TMAO reductase-like tetraheme cytochrome c subunit
VSKKDFDVNKSWIKFILAGVLLNAFILASFLTSTPEESPAATWKVYYQEARYAMSPIEDEDELARMHEDAGSLDMAECIACHGDKESSDLPLHQIHLTSELLPGLECMDCHRSISLEERTNVYSVRLVDVSFCKECHSAFPGLEPGSPMKPEDFEVECTTCHTGKTAFQHQQHYLSHVIAPKECQGCHGGRVLPWTPAHERDDWLQKHGPDALDQGEETCFQCHEFGLQFCDDCHAEKPPSHEPRDPWLASHEERAQADTRTCFTCHVSDDCKECHVNHEEDWLAVEHDDYVLTEGSESCWECHSQSFCSFCHIERAGRPTDEETTGSAGG